VRFFSEEEQKKRFPFINFLVLFEFVVCSNFLSCLGRKKRLLMRTIFPSDQNNINDNKNDQP
tara:strand:- start:4055 stop:4240 length:186 start_codon:yes stop_codon:yes gene_type:complete